MDPRKFKKKVSLRERMKRKLGLKGIDLKAFNEFGEFFLEVGMFTKELACLSKKLLRRYNRVHANPPYPMCGAGRLPLQSSVHDRP